MISFSSDEVRIIIIAEANAFHEKPPCRYSQKKRSSSLKKNEHSFLDHPD